jgi:hypothetical protein
MSIISGFVRKVQDDLKARAFLPLGAAFEIGMVGVVDDDQFSPRGTVESILGVSRGEFITSLRESTWQVTSGSFLNIGFVASGESSTLFPSAPKATAKVEISFAKSESFLASATQLTVSTMREPLALLKAMIAAYQNGVWRKEYVFVYEAITPAEVLVLLSRNAGTNLLLTLDGSAGPSGLGDLAGKATLSFQSQDVIRLTSGGQPIFFNAFRVKDRFWTGPEPEVFSVGVGADTVFEKV